MLNLSLSSQHRTLEAKIDVFYDNEDISHFQGVQELYVRIEAAVVPRLNVHLNSIKANLAKIDTKLISAQLPTTFKDHCSIVTLLSVCENKLRFVASQRDALTDIFALWETSTRSSKAKVLEHLVELATTITRTNTVCANDGVKYAESDLLHWISPSSEVETQNVLVSTNAIKLENLPSAISAFSNSLNRTLRLDPSKQDNLEFLEAATDILESLARKQLLTVYALRTVSRYLAEVTRS